MFRGRHQEIHALSGAWEGAESTIIHLSGPSGIGKTSLVSEAGRGHLLLHLHCLPLPAPTQLTAVERDFEAAWRTEVGEVAPPPEGTRGGSDGIRGADWAGFFDIVLARVRDVDRPVVLVLDDAHRLTEARARIGGPLSELTRKVEKAGHRVHIVLVGRGGGLPEPPEKSPLQIANRIILGPLSAGEAEPFLPGNRPASRIRSYAVFGGTPKRLKLLDPSVSAGTNLRRLVLRPEGRLAREGLEIIERSVQSPSRYVAILRSLAAGEADWSRVHDGVSDLTKSGQVAPYLARLVELGLVEVRRSLDSGPGSRNRRYRIRDPFHQFWFRFLLGHAETVSSGAGPALWSDQIKPALDDHIESVFPEICRQFMWEGAEESFGANARESGSLWGSDYDIPVSGLLTSGGAFHGTTTWSEVPDDRLVKALDREIRETRYGFGREQRLRVVFSRSAPSRDLERAAARRSNLVLIGSEELLPGPVEPAP
jgi:AAA+ ATPase superfamily predicted ATPase